MYSYAAEKIVLLIIKIFSIKIKTLIYVAFYLQEPNKLFRVESLCSIKNIRRSSKPILQEKIFFSLYFHNRFFDFKHK